MDRIPCLRHLLLALLLGCTDKTDTGGGPGDDTGDGADGGDDSGGQGAITALDLSVEVVENPELLPEDQEVVFDVWTAHGLTPRIHDTEVPLGEMVRIEVEADLYDVWASFVWNDPERASDPDYVATECAAHETVEVSEDEIVPLVLRTECFTIDLD